MIMKILIGKYSAELDDGCDTFVVVETITNLLVSEGYPANFVRNAYLSEAERMEEVYVGCNNEDDTV